MRQAGVSIAPERRVRERAWIDFGVDEAFPPPPVAATRAAEVLDEVAAFEVVPRSPRSVPAPPRSPRSVAAAPRAVGATPRPVAVTPRPVAVTPRPVAATPRAVAATPRPVAATPLSPRSTADSFSPRSLPEPSTASHTRLPEPVIADATPAASHPPARRTVTIRGRGAERELAFPSHGTHRRPPTRRHERPGFKPDRAAMWAVLLGILLVLVAATSSHAAVLAHVAALHPAALHPAAALHSTATTAVRALGAHALP